MNKTLVGCLAVVLLLGIGGAVGAYYFVWRPAKAYVSEFAKLKEIPQLNQQVRKKASFSPPADQVITKDAVERFVGAQTFIVTKLGQRADELHAKYRLLAADGQTPRKPTFSELASAYRDMAGLIVEAKRAQVEALNQYQFSLAEYEWTRQRIYEAAGIPISADFEPALRAIAEGGSPDGGKSEPKPAPADVKVPEGNRALVEPYKKELVDRAVFAAFGL